MPALFHFQIHCPLLWLLTLLCLSISFSLSPFALGPPLCSTIVLCPRGPGFVESAFLYPLDLAGLEHAQSAFSLCHRHGVTSQCEYDGTLP